MGQKCQGGKGGGEAASVGHGLMPAPHSSRGMQGPQNEKGRVPEIPDPCCSPLHPVHPPTAFPRLEESPLAAPAVTMAFGVTPRSMSRCSTCTAASELEQAVSSAKHVPVTVEGVWRGDVDDARSLVGSGPGGGDWSVPRGRRPSFQPTAHELLPPCTPCTAPQRPGACDRPNPRPSSAHLGGRARS